MEQKKIVSVTTDSVFYVPFTSQIYKYFIILDDVMSWLQFILG